MQIWFIQLLYSLAKINIFFLCAFAPLREAYSFLSIIHRQINCNFGVFSFLTFKPEPSSMIFDNAMADGKLQPCALTLWLSGKKVDAYSIQNIIRDSIALIINWEMSLLSGIRYWFNRISFIFYIYQQGNMKNLLLLFSY